MYRPVHQYRYVSTYRPASTTARSERRSHESTDGLSHPCADRFCAAGRLRDAYLAGRRGDRRRAAGSDVHARGDLYVRANLHAGANLYARGDVHAPTYVYRAADADLPSTVAHTLPYAHLDAIAYAHHYAVSYAVADRQPDAGSCSHGDAHRAGTPHPLGPGPGDV
jgi:hypothetical protein